MVAVDGCDCQEEKFWSSTEVFLYRDHPVCNPMIPGTSIDSSSNSSSGYQPSSPMEAGLHGGYSDNDDDDDDEEDDDDDGQEYDDGGDHEEGSRAGVAAGAGVSEAKGLGIRTTGSGSSSPSGDRVPLPASTGKAKVVQLPRRATLNTLRRQETWTVNVDSE